MNTVTDKIHAKSDSKSSNKLTNLTAEQQAAIARDEKIRATRAARSAAAAAKRAEREKIRAARKAADLPLTTPEEKAADFKRLAELRTKDAILAIQRIGHLSARGSYAYTPEQVRTIRALLDGCVELTMGRFVESDKEIKVTL